MTTRRQLLVILAAAITGSAARPIQAQGQAAASDGFIVLPRYTPGQIISLQIESRIQDARDNSAEQVYHAPVTLRVLRNSTAGSQLEWQAGKGKLENGVAGADPMVQMAEQIITDLGLRVQLDPAGRYLGVQNEAGLKARIEAFTNLLIPQATAKISDSNARQRAQAAMKAALSPEAMLSAARKELDLYFGLCGLKLLPGQITRKKSGLLNPFGTTGALSGEMEIQIETGSNAPDELTVSFRQHYDPNSTFQMNAGSQQSGRELAGLALDDSGEFRLDRATWQVRQARHIRTIRRNKEAVRVETTVITLQ